MNGAANTSGRGNSVGVAWVHHEQGGINDRWKWGGCRCAVNGAANTSGRGNSVAWVHREQGGIDDRGKWGGCWCVLNSAASIFVAWYL